MTDNFTNAMEDLMASAEMLYKYFATDENKFDHSLVQIRKRNSFNSSINDPIISMIIEPLTVIIDFRDNISMGNAMMLIYHAVKAMYAEIGKLYKEFENFDGKKSTFAPSLGDVSDIIPIKMNYTKSRPFIVSFQYNHFISTIPNQEKLDEYKCADIINLSSYMEDIVNTAKSKEIKATQFI